MLLHSDRYFDHVYEVRHDMLSVKWLTIESLYMPEILHSVKALGENIRNYSIRHLLIDASEIHEHSSVLEDQEVVRALFSSLTNSHLEKLARVESKNCSRESILKQNIPEINNNNLFEVEFFKDLASAQVWLTELPVADAGLKIYPALLSPIPKPTPYLWT